MSHQCVSACSESAWWRVCDVSRATFLLARFPRAVLASPKIVFLGAPPPLDVPNITSAPRPQNFLTRTVAVVGRKRNSSQRNCNLHTPHTTLPTAVWHGMLMLLLIPGGERKAGDPRHCGLPLTTGWLLCQREAAAATTRHHVTDRSVKVYWAHRAVLGALQLFARSAAATTAENGHILVTLAELVRASVNIFLKPRTPHAGGFICQLYIMPMRACAFRQTAE